MMLVAPVARASSAQRFRSAGNIHHCVYHHRLVWLVSTKVGDGDIIARGISAIRRRTGGDDKNECHVSSSVDHHKHQLWMDDLDDRAQQRLQRRRRTNPRIIFPGGGIFFYWQAGVVSHLRSNGYDLSQTPVSGASAGAITATLTVSDVDMDDATTLAIDLARESGLWDDGGSGLGGGVWGPLIERWLYELLPDDAADRANQQLSLVVTHVPTFEKRRITHFDSKEDLVQCNMASVHLPWFLNRELTCTFRNGMYVDGSIGCIMKHYIPPPPAASTNMDSDGDGDHSPPPQFVRLDWKRDPVMLAKVFKLIKLTSSEDGIWGMVERGRKFAEAMDERGEFDALPRL